MTRSTTGLAIVLLGALGGACLETEPIDLGGDLTRDGDTSDASASEATDTGDATDTSDAQPDEGDDPTPCLNVTPALTDFGGTLVGTSKTATLQVTNCGAAPIDITDVSFGPNDPRAFDLERDASSRLEPGASQTVAVTYTPTAVAARDADGAPVRDTATLHVTVDVTSFRAALRGWGAAAACPTPVIRVEEGTEVVPETALHLSGVASFGVAPIVAWEWSVTQPSGSAEVLRPAATVPTPTFTPNVAGTYTFRLEVVDALGTRSCAPAELSVTVITGAALRIELTWRTTEGASDEDTADLDLHFRHPFALGPQGDGYFDLPYDAFWFNAHPNWGAFTSSDDDPWLVVDSVDDGAETLELPVPEDSTRYCVGVHFWSPRNGRAVASLRIYIDGALTYDARDVGLAPSDMWDVACLTWPGAVVDDLAGSDGQPRITSGYTSSFLPEE